MIFICGELNTDRVTDVIVGLITCQVQLLGSESFLGRNFDPLRGA